MLQLDKALSREKFSEQIRELVETGNTYFDSIVSLQQKYSLHEKEIPRLLDTEIKEKLETEMLAVRAIKPDEEPEDEEDGHV